MPNVNPAERATLPQFERVLRTFLPCVKPHTPALGGALLLGAIVAITEVVKPWPLQVVFDLVLGFSPGGGAVEMHGPSRWFQPRLESWRAPDVLLAAALSLLVVSVIGGLAVFSQTVLLSKVGQTVVARLRRDLFHHLMRLPPHYHSGQRQGDLLMRLTGDIVLLRDLLVSNLLEAAAALLVVGGTLAAMLWMNWKLTLLSLALGPPIALASTFFSGRIRLLMRKNRRKEGELAASAGEALGAVHVLQAFGAAERVAASYDRRNRSALRAGLRTGRVEALLTRMMDLLTASGTAVTLLLGAAAVQRGELSAGGLLVFLTYQRTLFRPVRQLARVVARSAKASVCGERVLEVLQTPPAVADRPEARDCGRVAGAIELDRVTVRYPRGDLALDDVSFRVPAGGVAVVRGESGAGKSTLLSLVPRLLEPSSGTVRIDGRDVRECTLASLRTQVAMVFQDSVLLGLSVRENIALGDPDAPAERVESAAEAAGVMRFARGLPDGLDTLVGERGAQLSGGQRQRVALARAALRDAPILVLDEPFAHLDEDSRDHVLAALRRVAANRTVLLVTHQDHPGFPADIEVMLAGGRVAWVREESRAHPARVSA
jgi:ATP-binding cassette subfamily B protein